LKIVEDMTEENGDVTKVKKLARQHVWIGQEAISQLKEDVGMKAYLRKPEHVR
jgi:hypothetical protein